MVWATIVMFQAWGVLDGGDWGGCMREWIWWMRHLSLNATSILCVHGHVDKMERSLILFTHIIMIMRLTGGTHYCVLGVCETEVVQQWQSVNFRWCFFTFRWCTGEIWPSWFASGTLGGKWNGPEPGATSKILLYNYYTIDVVINCKSWEEKRTLFVKMRDIVL